MPDIRNFGANTELLCSWGRYLYWAELMKREHDKFMEESGAKGNKAISEWLGLRCYWAASLYVVIEGWETAKFKDPIVDALLTISNYKDVLRRLRNGTFHYQPAIVSQKVVDFFQSPDVILWLCFLQQELCRWLRDFVETVERATLLPPEQAQEWRDDFADLVGWLPPRLGEEKQKALKKKCEDIGAMLDASGSTTEAAKDLRASLGLYDTTVKKTAEGVRAYRREILGKFGLNPDNYIA
jgi:hypothetical protein